MGAMCTIEGLQDSNILSKAMESDDEDLMLAIVDPDAVGWNGVFGIRSVMGVDSNGTLPCLDDNGLFWIGVDVRGGLGGVIPYDKAICFSPGDLIEDVVPDCDCLSGVKARGGMRFLCWGSGVPSLVCECAVYIGLCQSF